MEEDKKVDISENGSRVLEMIEKHREHEKKLFRMPINAQTTIYVTAENNNEAYKRKWMIKNGCLKDKTENTDVDSIRQRGRKPKVVLDFMMLKKELYDGTPLEDLASDIGVTKNYLRERLRIEGFHVPRPIEIIDFLKKKGMTEDEIVEKTRIKRVTVHNFYNKE